MFSKWFFPRFVKCWDCGKELSALSLVPLTLQHTDITSSSYNIPHLQLKQIDKETFKRIYVLYFSKNSFIKVLYILEYKSIVATGDNFGSKQFLQAHI